MSSPAGVNHILAENNKNYGKQTRGYASLRYVLGNGLLTSEGDFWKRQRRIAQPAFHKRRIAERIIAERRRKPGDDLLSMLMEARDESTGERMDDRQLRDEAMTIFLAGHETTSNALTWTWLLLSRYPAALRELRAELQAVLGGRAPALEDLPPHYGMKMRVC